MHMHWPVVEDDSSFFSPTSSCSCSSSQPLHCWTSASSEAFRAAVSTSGCPMEKTDSDSCAINEEFPLTAMPVKEFMGLKKLQSYQECLAKGLTTQTIPEHAAVLFCSHQWLSFEHPDPQGIQLRDMQHILKTIIDGDVLDIMDPEAWRALAEGGYKIKQNGHLSPTASMQLGTPFQHSQLTVEGFTELIQNAYIWWDFFSVPQNIGHEKEQGEAEVDNTLSDGSQRLVTVDNPDSPQVRAIRSIPHYIERASFFFVIAPPALHADTGEVCDLETWRGRGWCRLEECANYLSITTMSPIFLTGEKQVHVQHLEDYWIHVANTREGAVGCGKFTCCAMNHKRRLDDGTEEVVLCDKGHCMEVVEKMWRHKKAHGEKIENLNVTAFTATCSSTLFATGPGSDWHVGPLLGHISDPREQVAALQSALSPMKRVLGSVAQVGCTAPVQELLRLGEALEELDILGRSPLHNACIHGNVDMVRFMLEHAGARRHVIANLANKHTGVTPLVRAAQQGHTAVVQQLLDAGADTSCQRVDTGDSALHCAAAMGRHECVRLLLEANANACMLNHKGQTALDLAAGVKSLFGSASGRRWSVELLESAAKDQTKHVGVLATAGTEQDGADSSPVPKGDTIRPILDVSCSCVAANDGAISKDARSPIRRLRLKSLLMQE